ncbi:MAG: nucleotidyltransferase [Candidatus Thiodiazotropha endolucinida]
MNDTTANKGLQLINVLDGNLRQIELTATQQQQLETAYKSVAEWLADSDHPLLRNVEIYPQGSVRLRTTVRPLGKEEFDVDLVCFLPDANQYCHSADFIYQLVGGRLKEHGVYKRMVQAKNRCWRLVYADGTRFHMDITPAMPNLNCDRHGILVPDRDRQQLKPSNPIGYANIFDGVSQLVPEFRSLQIARFAEAMAKASIELLPDPMQPKDFLRRIVQIIKRHRDMHFQEHSGHPPISIILTTLAMESYAALTKGVFDDPWQFIRAVIGDMPLYVRETESGVEVPNPSTEGENFAEKWNQKPQRALDFYRWHKQFVVDIDELMAAQGFDQTATILNERLIGPESTRWQESVIGSVNTARANNSLYRTPGYGGISVVAGTPIQKNTFYGGQ